MNGEKLIVVVVWATIAFVIYEALQQVFATLGSTSTGSGSVPNVNGLFPFSSGPIQTSTTALPISTLTADAQSIAGTVLPNVNVPSTDDPTSSEIESVWGF